MSNSAIYETTAQQVNHLVGVLFATVYNTTGEAPANLKVSVGDDAIQLTIPHTEWAKVWSTLHEILYR